MSLIKIHGNNAQLFEDDHKLIKEIDNLLSFAVAGAEYTKAYQGWYNYKTKQFEKWDGIHRILTSKGMFPTGLVDKLKEFYKNKGLDLEIEDLRDKPEKNDPLDISEKLKELNLTPRDYQISSLQATQTNDRGILRLCTGAGKSLLAALITADKNTKTIIYVIGKDLLYQFYNLFVDIFGKESVGIIGDGKCDIKKFNIASVWSFGPAIGLTKNILIDSEDEDEEKALSKTKYKDLLRLIKDTELHILDECHMASCDTIQSIYKNCNAQWIYGLSGTPWRDDNSDLLIEGILGRYIANVSASDLIERDVLAKPFIRFVDVPAYPTKIPKNYQTIYKTYIVENDDRNDLIVKNTLNGIKKGYQCLILFKRRAHGVILFDRLKKEIDCALLDGNNTSEERAEVKEAFLKKEINCILASSIFDIGVDIPTISMMVLAGGGKSTSKALQRIGRCIRKAPGKTNAIVIDFHDNATFLKNHSLIRRKVYSSEKGFDVK